jgi:hypothetical protein
MKFCFTLTWRGLWVAPIATLEVLSVLLWGGFYTSLEVLGSQITGDAIGG